MSREAARCAQWQGNESHCSSVGARRQTKRTAQGLPGEPECEKSLTRGRGFPLPPQNFGDFGSRLLCPLQSGRGAARPCCHLTAGRGEGSPPPQRGIFHHKHRVTVGPMGPFHCCRPGKQKDLILTSCPPPSTGGRGTQGSSCFPKEQGKGHGHVARTCPSPRRGCAKAKLGWL